MSFERREVLVKITPAGTISLPKQFRKFIDLQKGDYVKVTLENNHLIVRKAIIT
jgi:AbrB family looped-hinge helix DNA binding protein